MSILTNDLENLIDSVPKVILALKNYDEKPTPSKWSKKEILGHLCDSATLNHKRFIDRLISTEDIQLELYKQNEWVELNNYHNRYSLEEVIALWILLNKRIVKVISNTTEEQLKLQYITNDEKNVTFEWLFTDYVDHLRHHLRQILE